MTRVVQAIQGQILGGRLAVGTKLPPEREFSERLGVSRTVVREAVRILVTKGLLDTDRRTVARDALGDPSGTRNRGAARP